MPIRMVEDDPQGNKKKQRRVRSNAGQSSGGGRSLGGGLGGIVTSLLPMLLKKPKLLLIVAVIGIAAYFFLGKGCSTNGVTNNSNNGGIQNLITNFMRGGEMDEKVYEEVEIYEPLADNIKNPLPEKVSLLKYAPTRLNQGKQGSCVAWASAYAARTILESMRTGKNPNSVRFSPSFMYNQISIDKNTCQGSYIKLAMDNMMGIGAVPFNDFKYNQNDCNRKPGEQLKARAQAYKIRGFQRLTDKKSLGPAAEMLAIKQNLANGSPVIIGMMVGGSFMQNMMGRDAWIPTRLDYNKRGFGGHAMCVIGYDDYKEGGSFQIMNSWGEDWGNKGVAWVRYSDFKFFNVESYGLYPMGNADERQQSRFEGNFGLELNPKKGQRSAQMIPLRQVGPMYFETTKRLTSSDKFKVEFTNNIECYTYIFGEETDGSSYTLFPYTEKHSPYCGITGTRVFPRDYSMQPDDKGKKDKIAVIITKNPIDYKETNKKINSASGNSYQEKVANALRGQYESNVRFSGSNTINFEGSTSNGKNIFFVIAVNK